MQTIWEEFAEAVGRVLADRWIRQQERAGPKRRVDPAVERRATPGEAKKSKTSSVVR